MKVVLLIILMVVTAFEAKANLLITPTRVLIKEGERGGRISVSNSSNTTQQYQIEWLNQIQLPNGDFYVIPDNKTIKGVKFANDLVRYGPSQVLLKPGERQHVRFSARRNASLTNGDYKSFVSFVSTPISDKVTTSDANQQGSSFTLTVNLGFNVPVILRVGEPAWEMGVSSVKPVPTTVDDVVLPRLDVQLSKKSSYTAYGDLKLYFLPSNGQERVLISEVANLSLYPETSKFVRSMSALATGKNDLSQMNEGIYQIVFVDDLSKRELLSQNLRLSRAVFSN